METNSHVIEITVISAEELYVNRRQRVKKNAYAIVKTDAYTAQRTNMDKDGGSYPAWNEKLVMNLPLRARYVTVEVHCKMNSGDKVIGTVNIPTSDFLGGYVPEGYLHFLSYRLRDGYGERNGIVNLSVRVKATSQPGNRACATASCSSQPWPGVAVGDKVSNGTGIATGVPVSYDFKF